MLFWLFILVCVIALASLFIYLDNRSESRKAAEKAHANNREQLEEHLRYSPAEERDAIVKELNRLGEEFNKNLGE